MIFGVAEWVRDGVYMEEEGDKMVDGGLEAVGTAGNVEDVPNGSSCEGDPGVPGVVVTRGGRAACPEVTAR